MTTRRSNAQRLLLAAAAVATLHGPLLWAADPKPTRDAFLAECLDAKPTPTTPKFNDYRLGSYHVVKDDLLKGLTDEAKNRKLALRAVLVCGPRPGDPLWTSYVTVFLREGARVRVNHLVMPHARITWKGTVLIPADRYDKWLSGALDTGVLQKEPPEDARAEKGEDRRLRDKEYHLLLVVWDADGKAAREYYGSLRGDEQKLEKFSEAYNAILKDLKKTYPESD
jgi:hypothetical protein